MYNSEYTGAQIDGAITAIGKTVQVMQIISFMVEFGVQSSSTTNVEWKNLILDSGDKILAGVRVDGTVFIADL